MKRIIGLCAVLAGFFAVSLIAESLVVLKVKTETASVHVKPDIKSDLIALVKFGALFESSNKVGNFFEISITDKDGNIVPGFLHSSLVEIQVTEEEKVTEGEEKAKEPEPNPEVRTQRVEDEKTKEPELEAEPQRVEQAHARFKRAGNSLFGIAGGYSKITSSGSDLLSGGFYLSGHGLFQVAPGLNVGLWGAYHRWGLNDSYFQDFIDYYAYYGIDTIISGSGSNIQIFPCLRYEFVQSGSFRPFIHVGGGLSVMKAKAEVSVSYYGYTDSEKADQSATRLGGNIGLGARLLTSSSMGIEAIALYNLFSREGGGTTNWFSIGLGLSFGQ